MDTVIRNKHRKALMRVAAQAYNDGDLEAALRLYQRLLKGEPNDPGILFYVGNVYRQQGKLVPAAKAYRKALLLEPNFFEALLNLSMVLRKKGALHKALQICRQALRVAPDSEQAHNHAGTINYMLGDSRESLNCYRKAIALNPSFAEAHYNFGNILKKEGQFGPAEKAYRRAISLKPDFYQAINGLGDACRAQGRNEQAMQAYEMAIAVRPGFVAAYRNLAAIREFSREDRYVREMKTLLANAKLEQSERISLNFALAKACEDFKQFDAAFAYMAEGNRLKRATFAYDKTTAEELFANIRKTFSKTSFEGARGHGVEDPSPIFIIGMPRSGTSLLEQVLSRHPKVFGAGELSSLDQIVTAYGKKVFNQSYPRFMHKATKEDFLRMGAAYVNKVKTLKPDAAFITDKMPQNFLFAGLIHLIMPKATVIHCVRTPQDTCLSIFKNDFTRLHQYGYDLDELGHYYGLYQNLMHHWHEIMPGIINEFHYEEMVTAPEKQVRRLLSCCGLAWDRRCLKFHESSRPVLTASTVQVRKPFYSDSIALWRNYERHLAPLLENLP